MVQENGLQWLAVTNTMSQEVALEKCELAGIADRLKVIDVSRLVAGAIIRIHLGASVNLPKFRQIGPTTVDKLLSEAALVPTSQYTLRGAPTFVPTEGGDD